MGSLGHLTGRRVKHWCGVGCVFGVWELCFSHVVAKRAARSGVHEMNRTVLRGGQTVPRRRRIVFHELVLRCRSDRTMPATALIWLQSRSSTAS
ncbi:hypothetical protein MRB53_041067 [Persea americana]|nr:hypothetical protein MRB53_041067 [Persea americana]